MKNRFGSVLKAIAFGSYSSFLKLNYALKNAFSYDWSLHELER